MCLLTTNKRMTVCSHLTCLVESNEPIAGNRGYYRSKEAGDTNPHSVHCYSHGKDENTAVQNSWHTSENNVEMSPQGDSFSFEPPSPLIGTDDENGVVFPTDFSINVETQDPYLNRGCGNNEVTPEQSAIKECKKTLHSLKKKIKQYEEEFYTDFGYRPSHSEMRKNKKIKKYMSELSKAHKELKQMKDGVTHLDVIPSDHELTTVGYQQTISHQISADAASTLQKVEERLKKERIECGREENMAAMTFNELREEKTAIQKALLYYENIHGRPETEEDKDLARPLYDRYRQCKRYVLRAGSHPKESIGDLAPIIEHETMYFTQVSPLHQDFNYQEESQSETDEEDNLLSPPNQTDRELTSSSLQLGNLHSLPLRDLKNRKKEVREEKKRLRKALNEIEEQFERDFGRKIQKEDRGTHEQTYVDYKHSKAKLRLIEALLSKLQPTRY